MGTLKKCLSEGDKGKRIRDFLEPEEISLLLNASEKYKAEGDSQMVADSKAVVDFNEYLHRQMNSLRTKIGLKSPDFKKPEIKIVEPPKEEVKEEPKVEKKPELKPEPKKEKKEIDAGAEVKATPIEVSNSDRGYLIDKGYDNVEINRAEKEANRIINLPVIEMFKELQKKGIFNLGRGEKMDARPDLGLDKTYYNNTLRRLEEGKNTVTVKKLIDFLNQIKKDGTIPMLFDTGGMAKHNNIPLVFQLLGEDSGQEVGMSKEEEESKLAEEKARNEYEKAKAGDQYQKVADRKGDIQKVLDRIKKVMPKVNVVVDEKMEAAGKVQGNTLTINPYYAGIDTPIHEAGHILIDTIGYKNKVIQAAIKQLQDTELWKETKKRYPELNDEMLAKEVLAEAIGREGAGIFDKEVDKNRFMTFLDYIFTKLKQLLGIDKNIAKSLAKQIIAGIETKELTGSTAEEQFAKAKRNKSQNEQDIDSLLDLFENEPDLSKFKHEDLQDAYNIILTADDVPNKKIMEAKRQLQIRIAMNLTQRATNKVKNDPKYSEEKAIHTDLSWAGKVFNTLSHFGVSFTDMRGLNDLFQVAHFNKTIASKKAKKVAEKLAVKVIEDRNARLGITTRSGEALKQLLGNQNYKYFDYMDNGKGELITVEEAEKKSLSEAQINFLKYTREKIGEKKGLSVSESHDAVMESLKMDKKFYESFQTENAVAAMSALLGNTYNINNVRIEFTNPETGKTYITEYENIEDALAKYGEKGVKEKINAMRLITKYNFKARRQLRQQVNADQKGEDNVLNIIRKGEYSLDENGKLRSKFDKPRDPKRPYSKDFYSALHEFIDETEHIRYMSPLVPIINSIDYINKQGVTDANGKTLHAKKENVTEWLKDWSDLHILKRPKEFDPALDSTLKFLRVWASMATMMFNVPAQGMNLAIGLYNNWRKDSLKYSVKGLARLFKTQDGALMAKDLIQKYGASSTDMDSNPIQSASSVLAKIGFFGTKWGEFIIQGSGLLGKMSKEDLNSFEYKTNKYGIKELEVKDSLSKEDKEALEKRILDYIDEVSDVQGKYSEKDRRNFMNNEVGKAIAQYKTWMPDWFLTRFGERGSISNMVKGGFAELKKDIKEKGAVKGFWENKDFMSNLKEAMTIVMLFTLAHSDDDDDEKSLLVKKAEKALGDVLFIFDPNTLKFTISRPVASISKINDLLDAGIALSKGEGEKAGKKALNLVPGKKAIDMAQYLVEEED